MSEEVHTILLPVHTRRSSAATSPLPSRRTSLDRSITCQSTCQPIFDTLLIVILQQRFGRLSRHPRSYPQMLPRQKLVHVFAISRTSPLLTLVQKTKLPLS